MQASFNTILLVVILAVISVYRKNTALHVMLLAFSIPFEPYVNWHIGFTLKPAQLFAFSCFLSLILNKEKVISPLNAHLPFLAILCAAGLSLINAPKELVFRSFQGSLRMMFNFALLYFIAYTISLAIKNKGVLKKTLFAFTTGVFCTLIIEFIRSKDILFSTPGTAIDSQPFHWLPWGCLRLGPDGMAINHYSAHVSIALVIMAIYGLKEGLIKNRLYKFILAGIFTICFYGFILTFSRGPWIGFFIALTIILYYLKQEINLKKLIACGVLTLISSSFLLLVYPKTLEPAMERAALGPVYRALSAALSDDQSNMDQSSKDRFDMWLESIHMFKKHPVIGNGWASNLTPHNVFLQILSESGLVGLLSFLFFGSFVISECKKGVVMLSEEDKTMAIGIWACLLSTVFLLMLDIGLYQIQTWFIIGLSLTIGRLAHASEACEYLYETQQVIPFPANALRLIRKNYTKKFPP